MGEAPHRGAEWSAPNSCAGVKDSFVRVLKLPKNGCTELANVGPASRDTGTDLVKQLGPCVNPVPFRHDTKDFGGPPAVATFNTVLLLVGEFKLPLTDQRKRNGMTTIRALE